MTEGVVGGKYRLEGVVGSGTFGTVFRAKHVDIGRVYAIKFLEIPEKLAGEADAIRTRFLREAKILGRLDHPNTVQVVDFGQHGDQPYIVTEYLEGRTLHRVIKDQGPFDENHVVTVTEQILGSVAQAHELGLIHRDLKSNNVMLVSDANGEEVAKLLDFGVATPFREDSLAAARDLKVTVRGSFIGTPQYAAPEQFGGEVSAASDVYAIGLLMWEMITGTPAVRKRTFSECMQIHMHKEPWKLPPEARVSAQMRNVVETALQRDPARRYADAGEMLTATGLLGSAGTQAHAEPATLVTADVEPADDVIAGKYRLEKLIGAGGFSRVFKAVHVDMQRPVAVKLLDLQGAVAVTGATTAEDLRARFGREARLVSKLTHPNTITVYDFGVDRADRWYIAMEYVEGPNLFRALKKQGAFEPRRAALVARDILRSLSEAHHLGILHRDLKPGNVMMTKDYEGKEVAKVLDFGIATVHGVETPGTTDIRMSATRMGAFVGTPQYAAPEQFLGEKLTPAADVYAVGLVLWEMLTGSPAVSDDVFGRCLQKHLSKEPWRLPEHGALPQGLLDIMYGALEKEPSRRYLSASDMASDLDSWLDGKKESFKPAPVTEERWEPAIEYKSVEESLDVDSFVEDDSGGIGRADTDERAIIDPNIESSQLPEFLSAPDPIETPARRPATAPAPRRPARNQAKIELDYDRAGIRPGGHQRVVAPTHVAQGGRRSPSRSPASWVIGIAGALLVGLAAYSLWPTPSQESVVSTEELMRSETMYLDLEPAQAVEKPLTNRFTVAGILEAVKTDGWFVRKMEGSNALASVHQQSYRLSRGDSAVEIQVVTTKSTSIATQMADDTRPPIRSVVFDNKLVRVFPPTRGGRSETDGLVTLLARYRDLVLDSEEVAP